jgi:hypothetical protein
MVAYEIKNKIKLNNNNYASISDISLKSGPSSNIPKSRPSSLSD